MAMLLSNLVEKYPLLLLIFRTIHQWCVGIGLLRNPADVENISNAMSILFISQYIQREEVKILEGDEVFRKFDELVGGRSSDVNLCTKFENVMGAVKSETCNEQGKECTNLDDLGRMLVQFFHDFEKIGDIDIPEPFSRILGKEKVSELTGIDKIELLQDHMQRSYQLLAQYADVKIMLACISSEDYSVIFLSSLLSFSMSGVEKSKSREIARKTGATSVVIRPRLPRHRKAAILEVRGSEPAIRAVRRELERMTVQASADKWSLMSGSFVEGANLMLFEGSKSVKDALTLSPYIGPCNQTHDGLPQHLAFVKNPSTQDTQYMFNRFAEKFLLQFQVLERDYDPQLHGIHEVAVHFGRAYLFRIPHLFLEDSESVSIAMLRANKLKKGFDQTEREAPKEIDYVDQETQRHRRRKRRPRKEIRSDETSKKRVKNKPSRSSFFTIAYQEDKMKNFLRSHGFHMENAVYMETYSVDIYHEDVEFYVKFDEKLAFKEIRFPNLRWCVTDVKRIWQSNRNR
jgi:hypothetical protein